jgi:hypothetical protein
MKSKWKLESSKKFSNINLIQINLRLLNIPENLKRDFSIIWCSVMFEVNFSVIIVLSTLVYLTFSNFLSNTRCPIASENHLNFSRLFWLFNSGWFGRIFHVLFWFIFFKSTIIYMSFHFYVSNKSLISSKFKFIFIT